MGSTDNSTRWRAVGAGSDIGAGIGGGRGIVTAQLMDGDLSTGFGFGAGVGSVIALISGAAVYRTATTECDRFPFEHGGETGPDRQCPCDNRASYATARIRVNSTTP